MNNKTEQTGVIKVAQTTTAESQNPPIIDPIVGLFEHYANLEGLGMLGLLGGLMMVQKLTGKKSKLTTGRMANKLDVINAAKMSFKQMNPPPGVCEPSTLWAGTPSYWLGKNIYSASMQILLDSPATTFFPDAGRGVLALGIPGVGKTFSVIDRIIESAYAQAFSGIIYDAKGSQVALHYPLALMYGYGDKKNGGRIDVIAPGKDYSGVFNVLEVMKDSEDSGMASQIGKVVMENAGLKTDKGDAFFPLCGQALATGIVQTAKTSKKYADLALVYALFQLDNLTKRLEYNINRTDKKKLNPWIAVNFATFLSSKDAEKTAAGIKTQAQLIYTGFIQKDLLRCFIGKSTVPLRLDGKQLIIFEMDDKRKSVIAPLLATIIQLAVVENLSTKRNNPFFYAIDEAASIVLLDLKKWINQYRSHGGVPIIGIQFLQQLYDAYGREIGNAIAFALKTHVLFDPGDDSTAEKYSKRFGKKEVIIKSVTVNQNNGHTSRSISNQIHQVALINSDEILRFGRGKCIITGSPGYGNKKEAGFPYSLKIPIPLLDIKRVKEAERLWKERYIHQLREKAKRRSKDIDPTVELELRLEEAKKLLPLKEEEEAAANSVDKTDSSNSSNPSNSSNSSNSSDSSENKESGFVLSFDED